jgi:hypothetical protein
MKPHTIFALVVRLFGVYLVYKTVIALSALFTMSGVEMPGFRLSVEHDFSRGTFSRVAIINVLVLGAAAIWFLYGAQPIQDWAYPGSANDKNFKSSEPSKPTGPFCTACGKAIPIGATHCPACGWTQPGKTGH